MDDELRDVELEDLTGEVLPERELMSLISTDPADALAPPGEFGIQPYALPGEEENTRPVEPPGA